MVVASFLCEMMDLVMVDLMVVDLFREVNELSLMNLEMVGLLVVALSWVKYFGSVGLMLVALSSTIM